MKNILYVRNQSFLSANQYGIKVVTVIDKNEKYFAYDELSLIVIDHYRSYFSNHLILQCLEHDVALLICDKKHSPLVFCETIYGQTQRLNVLEYQMSLQMKTRHRIWHKIVVRKIKNQAKCLSMTGQPIQKSNLLNKIAQGIGESDRKNAEAYAAREYFHTLFGDQFKRGRYKDLTNACLNYGYAIIRTLIRREIVIHGMEPSFGVQHLSTENPFNLSDDLIEAYRPLVDYWIVTNILSNSHEEDELTFEDKKIIVQILLEKCIIDNKIYYIGDAIKITVSSYLKCIKEKSARHLKLPTFIEGGQ